MKLEALYPCQVRRRCLERLREFFTAASSAAQTQVSLGGAVSVRTELGVRRKVHFKHTRISHFGLC